MKGMDGLLRFVKKAGQLHRNTLLESFRYASIAVQYPVTRPDVSPAGYVFQASFVQQCHGHPAIFAYARSRYISLVPCIDPKTTHGQSIRSSKAKIEAQYIDVLQPFPFPKFKAYVRNRFVQ